MIERHNKTLGTSYLYAYVHFLPDHYPLGHYFKLKRFYPFGAFNDGLGVTPYIEYYFLNTYFLVRGMFKEMEVQSSPLGK